MVQQSQNRRSNGAQSRRNIPATRIEDMSPVSMRVKIYMGSFIRWYDSNTSEMGGDPTAFTIAGTWDFKSNGDRPDGIGVSRLYVPPMPTELSVWTEPGFENYILERYYLASNGIVVGGERFSNANWTLYRAALETQPGRAGRHEELELTGDRSEITDETELSEGQRPQGEEV